MHDEVAHMGIVNGAVRSVLPRVIRLRVIWVNADDVELFEIAELYSVERGELPSEHEMKQLARPFLGAVLRSHVWSFPFSRAPLCPIGRQRSTRRVRSIRSGCSFLPAATRLGKRGVGRL